ncbi:MAG: HEAT repeat domain-containing protein [Desulfobacterales bacterium]|nr:HEAT repeat domain-containing protein [Desulfobacterales bacterium]
MVDYANIHRTAKNDDAEKREIAVYQIGNLFQILSEKEREQAWNDLLALTKDEDSSVRRGAAYALVRAIKYMTDKEQASKDLLKLKKDEDSNVRRGAADALGQAFQYMTDKEQASNDLLALTKDEDSSVRSGAADALGRTLQYMTDKEQASNDLLALTKDKDSFVRMDAAFALGTAFQYVIDKAQATKELLKLAKDENSSVRMGVAGALGMAFQYVTDKKHAVNELLELINDEDDEVRRYAAGAFEPAFQYITDKEQAWKELLKLIKDEDSWVQMGAAYALGTAFQYISDKKQATKELLELTKDGVSVVSVSANYSLGKISIYKATEAESEDGLKDEMAKAIGYFEKSSQESKFYFNPAKFCLPFYRSYNAVISRQENAKEEIERNLEEAKQAVGGSECKEILLEAVENLANALQEAQKLRGLDEIQADLNAYRRYCDRTVKLLNETEDKAPGATKLIRKGLPIIDERIKGILAEIQEKTKALCIEIKDSPFEDIGKEVNKIGQNLLRVRDPIGLEKSVNNLEIVLSDICNRMAGIEKGEACELLEREKNEQYIEDKLPLMIMILSKVTSQIDKQKYEIREELVISVGGTLFGTGVQHNITIPLQEIAYDDLKNDLKTIGNKDVFNLATLPPKLAEKVIQYIDKIKGKR